MNVGDTIATSQHNPPFQDVASALTDSLSRDGLGGMRADLDLGGFSITNLSGDFRIGGGGDLRISSASGGNDTVLFNDNQSLSIEINGTVRQHFTTAGQVFWNTMTGIDAVSSARFQFNGNMAVDTGTTSSASAVSFFNGQGSSTRVGWIGTSGSSTSYNTSSDARLKKNIAPAADSGEVIDAIEVCCFDWILNGEHVRYGLISQQLLTVAPEVVALGPTEEDMIAADFSKLVPLLIKECQSLRARVTALEAC